MKFQYQIRYLKEMRRMVIDEKFARRRPNLPLYFVFRGLKEMNGLRYDITVLPPLRLGREYNKTQGHEHRGNFPEFYVVLEGRIIFLIQQRKGDQIREVLAVPAKKGEGVFIPGNSSHFSINPSKKETAVLGNWENKKSKNEYSEIEKLGGACYRYTLQGWQKNLKYKTIPPLKFKRSLKKIPKNLARWLKK